MNVENVGALQYSNQISSSTANEDLTSLMLRQQRADVMLEIIQYKKQNPERSSILVHVQRIEEFVTEYMKPGERLKNNQ